MSWFRAPEPELETGPCPALEMVIVPRTRDLGDGFEVRRVLPFAKRRMVGPFVFFDQMGPTTFTAGSGLDVRPHPHIGLATVTYLFEGEILHRDSLSNVQPIRPGAVNWMTAGRGITHSERTAPEARHGGASLFGIQSWVALLQRFEETDPSFVHHAAETLPVMDGEGKRVRLVAGTLYGARAPVATLSELFYADAELELGARLPLPAEHEERAAYIVSGAVDLAGERFEAAQMLVFRSGDEITMTAQEPSRVLLLGGATMDGPRYIWWNFVSSSQERIEAAKADWKAGRFAPVPGDTDFIPLPE
jgi:redox-sensitive bicupin YhaK (pirin superfamily)